MVLDLVVGSACLFLPPQIQAGVICGSFILGKIRNRRKKRLQVDKDPSVRNTNEVELKWSKLSCTLRTKDGKERKLLDDLHGEARPGRVLAIFGPSGSGEWYISLYSRWLSWWCSGDVSFYKRAACAHRHICPPFLPR